MIDGIKLSYRLTDYNTWKNITNIDFFTPINKDTGEIKEKVINNQKTTIVHIGKFEQYSLTIKESIRKTSKGETIIFYYLNIDGSLHKNYFGGQNYSPFTWDKLQHEIKHLEERLHIRPELAKINNLEVGVNIILPFPVFDFLQNSLISYKGNSFDRYNPDRKGLCLGFRCRLSQYEVKIYDKGKQFGLPYELMRFELRYLKMQKLNQRGINVLASLQVGQKVNNLSSLLLDAWENVLIYDNSINITCPSLKPEQKELLLNGSNPKYWERLKKAGKRHFNYKRKLFRELVFNNEKNIHSLIKELIKKEWENLANNHSMLPCVQEGELSDLTI